MNEVKKEVKWSLYAEMQRASSPVLLNPLTWRNGDQISNLKQILEFFKKFDNIADPKTKILIYKSMCGSGKCCDGDTLILTSKGIVRIEDIAKDKVYSQKSVEESFIKDIQNDNNSYIGSYVKSLNVNNAKLENDIISNIFDIGDSDILEINTKSGFNIKCTPAHKLIVIDDNCNIIFKDAKNISIGDNIAIASGTDIYGEDVDLTSFYQSDYYRKYKRDIGYQIKLPNKMNEDLAEFLGYFISEGYRKSDMQMVTYNDQQIIRDRIRIIMNKFGITSHEGYDDRRDINDRVSIDSKMFNDFILYLGCKDYSENKEIPWSISQSSKKIHIAFLRALFSGDGHISDPDNEETCRIQYYTKSKKLAEHVHIMLLNMRIFSYLSERIRDFGTYYHVTIHGKEDIKKYINDIGFVQDYKKLRCIDVLGILDARQSRDIRTIKNAHIRLRRIYEEFKKLAEHRKIIETWQEDISLGDKVVKINRSKCLTALVALKYRGINGLGQINGVWGTSKRQVLKLLKAMKECYYMEDFRYLYNIATSNIEFDIVEDKKEGRCHVYDLTIRDNHSYVGNGFINHNSATLLHIVEDMGRGMVIVPFKNLQRQYYDDYFTGKNKFILKKNGQRLSVAVMLGRGNFPCRWLAEQYDYQQRLIEESQKPENYGIIIPIDTNIINIYKADPSCANKHLPCSRPLMLIGNRKEPRWMVASSCPYWIPTPISKNTIDKWRDKVIDERKMNAGYMEDESEGIDRKDIEKSIPDMSKDAVTQLDYIQDIIKCHNIEYYQSVGWEQTGVFIRDEIDQNGARCPDICPYYKQFYAYARADCIVMNDAKWEIETMIGRKPKVNVEIIDEGDYWLDNRSVTLEFSRFMIDRMMPVTNRMQEMKRNTLFLFDTVFQDIKKKISEPTEEMKEKGINIISSKDYKELFMYITNLVLEYKKSVEEDDSTLQKMIDLAIVLKYIDKASISVEEGKKDDNKVVKIFIPFPDNLLKELFQRSSGNIIMTSGTIHSNFVLGTLFGINNDNYIVDFVEGRKESPGKLKCIKPKQMLRVNYTNWQSPEFRKAYDNMLNYILDNLKIKIDQITGKPGEGKILVLTPAKKYADGIVNRPDIYVDFAKNKNEDEGAKPLINTTLSDFMEKSIEDVRKIQPNDIEIDGDVLRTNQQIIVSTRMIRGTDLRDNRCRAVVMTKWPMSDLSAGYNQALKLRFGDKTYWSIMKDKAERDAIQYVSRGLRHDWDWEYFSTPDEYAFNRVYMLFTYE